MEEQYNEHEFDVLIEGILYPKIVMIEENDSFCSLSEKEKKEVLKDVIMEFCYEFNKRDDRDVIHVIEKIEQIKQLEKRIQEERKTRDFYDNPGYKGNEKLKKNIEDQIK